MMILLVVVPNFIELLTGAVVLGGIASDDTSAGMPHTMDGAADTTGLAVLIL